MRFSVIGCGLFFGLFGVVDSAFSDTVSAIGGLGFGRDSGMNDLKGSNPLFGAEYSFDLAARFQLGGFFENNFVTDVRNHSGSVEFMGALLRYQPVQGKKISPFVDGKIGMGRRTDAATEITSGMRLSYGMGAGVEFPLGARTSLGPRVDVKYVPNAATPGAGHQALTDCALMVSFRL